MKLNKTLLCVATYRSNQYSVPGENLSFAGRMWPTKNNQATIFPLETSNGLQMELMQTKDVTHIQLNHNKDPEA